MTVLTLGVLRERIDRRISEATAEASRLEAARHELTRRRPGRPRKASAVNRSRRGPRLSAERIEAARLRLAELDAHLRVAREVGR